MGIKGAGRSAAAVGAFCLIASFVISAQGKSQWDGMFTTEQATRGKMQYSDKCSACHGDDAEGGQFAPALTDDSFADKWNDKALSEIFERIRTTMPQNDPGSLKPNEVADILAFVLKQAKYPAGAQELPADTTM